jgi:hypothetical protein
MRDPKPTPEETFKEFMSRTGRVLREHGFSGSGLNYRRERGEQWQAINIQKSQWRCKGEPICFYVNIGFDFPRLRFKRWIDLPATLSKFIALKADTNVRIDALFPQKRFGLLRV